MPAFFLTLMACLIVTLAGREQIRVAQLAGALGKGRVLLAIIWICAFATSAIAAWASTLIAPLLTPPAKTMFIAIALLLSAGELAFLRAGPAPKEPTRSAGAIFIVIFAAQLTDAARFLVLALSIQTGEPSFAAIGGAIGSAIALSLAVFAGKDWEGRVPHRLLAYGAAAILLVIAIYLGLLSRGII